MQNMHLFILVNNCCKQQQYNKVVKYRITISKVNKKKIYNGIALKHSFYDIGRYLHINHSYYMSLKLLFFYLLYTLYDYSQQFYNPWKQNVTQHRKNYLLFSKT